MDSFQILLYVFIFTFNLVVLFTFIRVSSKTITNVVKVNMETTISDYQKLLEQSALNSNKEIKDNAHFVKCQIDHNYKEINKIAELSKEVHTELHSIIILMKGLEKTIDNRKELENEVIKLKNILKRKGV